MESVDVNSNNSPESSLPQDDPAFLAASRSCNRMAELKGLHKSLLPRFNVFFDPRALLNSLLLPYAHLATQKGLGFDVRYNQQLPHHLQGDPVGIERLLSELVANAVERTTKGDIEIRLVSLWQKGGKGYVELRVTDTGPGLSPTQWRQLSLPTEEVLPAQTSQLGLLLIKHYIKHLGGEIEVLSDPDKGTAISCILPVAWIDDTGQTIKPVLMEGWSMKPGSMVSFAVHGAASHPTWGGLLLQGSFAQSADSTFANQASPKVSYYFPTLGPSLETMRRITRGPVWNTTELRHNTALSIRALQDTRVILKSNRFGPHFSVLPHVLVGLFGASLSSHIENNRTIPKRSPITKPTDKPQAPKPKQDLSIQPLYSGWQDVFESTSQISSSVPKKVGPKYTCTDASALPPAKHTLAFNPESLEQRVQLGCLRVPKRLVESVMTSDNPLVRRCLDNDFSFIGQLTADQVFDKIKGWTETLKNDKNSLNRQAAFLHIVEASAHSSIDKEGIIYPHIIYAYFIASQDREGGVSREAAAMLEGSIFNLLSSPLSCVAPFFQDNAFLKVLQGMWHSRTSTKPWLKPRLSCYHQQGLPLINCSSSLEIAIYIKLSILSKIVTPSERPHDQIQDLNRDLPTPYWFKRLSSALFSWKTTSIAPASTSPLTIKAISTLYSVSKGVMYAPLLRRIYFK